MEVFPVWRELISLGLVPLRGRPRFPARTSAIASPRSDSPHFGQLLLRSLMAAVEFIVPKSAWFPAKAWVAFGERATPERLSNPGIIALVVTNTINAGAEDWNDCGGSPLESTLQDGAHGRRVAGLGEQTFCIVLDEPRMVRPSSVLGQVVLNKLQQSIGQAANVPLFSRQMFL